MQKKINLAQRFVIMLLMAVMLLAVVSSSFIVNATSADYSSYSDVIDDLSNDESFSMSYYPTVVGDYSLSVVQLGESVDSELFIYVYQPSGQNYSLTATSINISTTINDYVSYYNYKLELLNSSDTLFKYKVTDFTVKSDTTRYYSITSIYRYFDETIDVGADYDNTITEVNYDVSKQYCFSTINGMPYCSVVDIETITVTDKFVGFVRYSNGFSLYPSSCDSHFVAFSTDKDIDNLIEADVSYTTQSYCYSFTAFVGDSETFGDVETNEVSLTYTDEVEHTGDGWFAGTYTWDRIETVDQFIDENDLTQNVYSGAVLDVSVANQITETGIAALENKEWVLRFCETDYTVYSFTYSNQFYSTLVGDVTILRLKFETDGITYNLGVIDNKQTGSDEPVNDEEVIVEISDDIPWWVWVLGALFLIIIILMLLPTLLKLVITAIASLVKYLGQAVIWLLSLPFKFIAWLIGGGK